MPTPPAYIGLCVGNTRTRVGLFRDGSLVETRTVASDEIESIAAEIANLAQGLRTPPVVMASVRPDTADSIEAALAASDLVAGVDRIGREIPIPLRHTLDDGSTLGQDRALNAIAAFEQARKACVVIDIGTAVTVDFVDGEGAFHGGVIFPGLNMMLRALHEQTAALPAAAFASPDPDRGSLGRDTTHAMMLGVLAAVRGGVRLQAEAAAEFFGAYPTIVATGGDMAVLEDDGLVEHLVPDLQLMGLALCVRHAHGDAHE